MRDLHSNLKVVSVELPAVVTADTTPTAIDLAGYSSAEIIAHFGAPGDTLGATTKFEIELTHSDDNSTYAAVAAADVIGATPDANGVIVTVDADGEASAVYQRGYIGGKRYLKVMIEVTGTHSTGTPIGITLVKGNALQRPVN